MFPSHIAAIGIASHALLIEHVNHLLNKSFPLDFTFSGVVLVDCVSSVAIKIVN